eukprot:CAMPEP_0202920508 /NCGR_PEP_ID=MMETSP1392-20130828/76895_1 /ASSEMBLY_ACC=CAM_ASM_000868 /TAXON_ID=225041 /ORGANISM="Chlamydomonas chlamydogama, Strain SAG 11-48b" /LENGTH=34 /DNA_ID= /DNA_START= /DNA_END= /DNA_ORIENTATION=
MTVIVSVHLFAAGSQSQEQCCWNEEDDEWSMRLT